jgi:protease-4
VSHGRGLPIEDIRPLAEGRLYTGEQALEAGLVDYMGSYPDAIDLAARMGGIEGDPKIVKRHFKRTVYERIFGNTLLPLVQTRHERVALRYIIP